MKKGPTPAQQYNLKPSSDKVLHLPPIDVDKLIKEDETVQGKGKPHRIGSHREINASPLTHGEWYDFDGKGSIWLFEIHSPRAYAISVSFSNFYLPQGSKVYVYSPSKPDKYGGPYDNTNGPDFGSDIIWGDDKIIIELAIPIPFDRSKSPFNIKGVGHFYRHSTQNSLFESSITSLSAICHNDATCSPNWATEGDAVGRLVF
ncbi:MAG: hypothetical protein HY755_10460 [Nitrospirae bacterium]|nr:hypothetical protein [Nitrospirota bacterium]